MKFCDILRNLIDERELTQRRLAADLCVAPSTVGSYVQGVREPDFDMLKRIATYFQVTTDYLLDCQSGIKGTREEAELLRIFRQLGSEQKRVFLEQGKVFLKVSAQEGPSSQSTSGRSGSAG